MLIKKNGKNYRTTFGRVVFHTLMTIEKAFVNYYKLMTIDSIGLDHDIPQETPRRIKFRLKRKYEVSLGTKTIYNLLKRHKLTGTVSQTKKKIQTI